MINKINKFRGFTLIEVIVTLLIVAILATGATPILELTIKRNKEIELKQTLRQIREAIDLYKKAFDEGKIKKTLDQSGYPPNLEILEEGVTNQKDPKGKRIKFIRKVPRDPMSSEPELKSVDTWAKRCYSSDVSFPTPGDDVYDVHSLSTKKAIDGTLYSSW